MSNVKTNVNEDGAIRDARKLGIPKMILLGLQHTFAMFGATVLVPIITGLSVPITLFMAGFGTLLFHVFTKFKVPAFLGSSFAFLGGYAAVAPMLEDGAPNKELLPYACAGVAVAGLLYLLLALLIKLVGTQKVMRFFPPVVTGPIIIAIGLILAPSAITNCMSNWIVAVTAIVVIIAFNIWGKGMMKIIPIILGIASGYIVALILYFIAQANPELMTSAPGLFTANGSALFSFDAVGSAKIIGLPFVASEFAFKPFLNFDAKTLSAIISIVPIALATMMEHIGDISAISATTGKNFIADPGLHRSLLGDGLATTVSSLFGGPANTTYGENTGVLVLTKVYDPRVIRIAAYFAIGFSFFPILGAAIGTIPTAVIGGVSLILYGMISAVGVRNIVDSRVDFTKTRNVIISAVILVSALGFNSVGGLVIPVGTHSITLSGLAIAALLGIILNAILPGKDYVFNNAQPNETGVNFAIGPSTTKEGKETVKK